MRSDRSLVALLVFLPVLSGVGDRKGAAAPPGGPPPPPQAARPTGPPPKTPAAKPPGPLQARIDATLEQVSPSVVTLWYGKPPRHVTGTIVTPDGLVVTCAHLSRKAGDPVEVRLADGRKVRGKVLAKLADGRKIRRGRDLALVQIIPKGPW